MTAYAINQFPKARLHTRESFVDRIREKVTNQESRNPILRFMGWLVLGDIVKIVDSDIAAQAVHVDNAAIANRAADPRVRSRLVVAQGVAPALMTAPTESQVGEARRKEGAGVRPYAAVIEAPTSKQYHEAASARAYEENTNPSHDKPASTTSYHDVGRVIGIN